MKNFLSMGILVSLMILSVSVHAEMRTKGCIHDPIVIGIVDINKLITLFGKIEVCVEKEGYAVAYVHGKGGTIADAQAFFDLMRTGEIFKKVTFIATGEIWSASNLVWLSAGKRIVFPGTQFVVHKASWNMIDEDPEMRTASKDIHVETSTDAVLLATGNEEASALWRNAIEGDIRGTPFGAEEAMRLGWATELRKYKKE